VGIHGVRRMSPRPEFIGERTQGPYVVYERCPPGLRWSLAHECAAWLPEYECVWTSAVDYDCWVKKWHCTAWQDVWGCHTPTFTVVG
jgi:hypothetical protein